MIISFLEADLLILHLLRLINRAYCDHLYDTLCVFGQVLVPSFSYYEKENQRKLFLALPCSIVLSSPDSTKEVTVTWTAIVYVGRILDELFKWDT